ncbi:Acg family FMN-binding oxidoreductase [Streptomyces tendae]|uniref:Acg family FMN-binding oxidoreductase n=1 Tax=Streptomyces tendae TaxID=1932 RepID=UPI00371281DA
MSTYTPRVDVTALETVLSAAVAAPSIHNTQPWRFRVEAATGLLQVRADRARVLPVADPQRRAQYLSVGAAVLNLRVAAAHLGWEPVVRLLPDPHDADLLADERLAGPRENPPDYRWLYSSVERRHTSRLPFTGRPVPEPVVAEMTGAAQSEGARLWVPDIASTRRLLGLTAVAEARNRTSPGRIAETRHWLTAPGTGGCYGIPLTALGPQDQRGRIPMRDFSGPLPVPHPPARRFERHAQVALLWTAHDRPQDWLRAGQALERVLLTATARGVRTSMLHQAMEWPDLRAAARFPQQRCNPQILIRYGYGPEGGQAPRARALGPDRPSAPPEERET